MTELGIVESVTNRLRAAGCVFAEDEAQVILSTASTIAEVDTMVALRSDGVPLEQVVGWAEFCGLRIVVEPGVFVPRRRTEFMVEQALAHAPSASVVVDLCCGSGAVAAALGTALELRVLVASDVDPAAVHCARHNVEPLGGLVVEGDLFGPLSNDLLGAVDLVTANVPYVPTDALGLMPAEARLHEATTALDGGSDGLAVLRRVADEAPRWLADGGLVLFETSERQVRDAAAAVSAAGLTASVAWSDDLEVGVVMGRVSDGRNGG